MKTFSIVIETENLGMAGLDDLELCLQSLEKQTCDIHQANEIVLVCGGHLTEDAQAHLVQRYPWVQMYPVGGYIDYTKAKELGAQYATGEIIVFADADVEYVSTWLATLLSVFERHADAGMSGGYTRCKNGSTFFEQVYAAAINVTWMFYLVFRPKPETELKAFQLNNSAVLRTLFFSVPIPHNTVVYRGAVSRWLKCLFSVHHVRAYMVTGAEAYHAAPGTFLDWLLRMLILGADPVSMADFTISKTGKVYESKNYVRRVYHFFRWLVWKMYNMIRTIVLLLREKPSSVFVIVCAIPLMCVHYVLFLIGGCCALVRRNSVYTWITSREGKHAV